MRQGLSLAALGLTLLLTGSILWIGPKTQPSFDYSNSKGIVGVSVDEGDSELQQSPCQSPTQEAVPGQDLQQAIDEAPEGAVLRISGGTLPRMGLVITKSITLCGLDPELGTTVPLRGPVEPAGFFEEEPDWAAIVWVIAEEPIRVRLEGLTLTGASGGLQAGVRVVGPAEVVLQQVDLEGNFIGLEATRGARLVLEDVAVVDNRFGIVVEESEALLRRVRLVKNETAGLFAIRASQVKVVHSWLLQNEIGIAIATRSLELDGYGSSVEVEGSWVIGNGMGSLIGYLGAFPSFDPEVHRNRLRLSRTQVADNKVGIQVSWGAQVEAEGSELIYNRSDGIWVSSLSADLRLDRNRIHHNQKCGISVPGVIRARSWKVRVMGRDNEVFQNAFGDLCPEDYPWPEGFRTPE